MQQPQHTSLSSLRAWIIVKICGIVYHSTANRRPGAPRLGWPGGCPTAPPMACPRHVAPPHPAVLAHVSRGASRFSCAGPARGGAHVGKAVPCGLGGPREGLSGCLREAAGAELRRGRALRRGDTALGICVRSVGTPYGHAPTTLTPASEVMYAVQRRPSAPGAWLCAQGGWQVARCRLGGPRRRPPPRAHGGWWSGLLCRAGRRLTRRFGVLAGGLSEAESMSRRRRC